MGLIITSGFPLEMPTWSDGVLPFNQATFKPLYGITKAPNRGGRQQVAELAPPLWQMQFATPTIDAEDAMELQTWLELLQGGLKLFKAYHPMLTYPLAYPNGFGGLTKVGGGDFDGTCTVIDFGETLDSLTLSGLPNGFKLRFGDMISMPFGDTQILHRITSAVTAGSSGEATFSVVPNLPISFAVSPEVEATFYKPWCYATVDADSIDGPFSEGRKGSVTFSAVQTY
jgi:hypothetical protein